MSTILEWIFWLDISNPIFFSGIRRYIENISAFLFHDYFQLGYMTWLKQYDWEVRKFLVHLLSNIRIPDFKIQSRLVYNIYTYLWCIWNVTVWAYFHIFSLNHNLPNGFHLCFNPRGVKVNIKKCLNYWSDFFYHGKKLKKQQIWKQNAIW